MLILPKIMEAMQDVTFYWAGEGQYREKIISELGQFKNFVWLGKLKHPDEVRRYLTEIDIYALISGLEMAGISLLEAELMKKPVICTKVGGIPEHMEDNKTGYLYDKGDPNSFNEKLNLLISNKSKRTQMGEEGHEFVLNNFQWKKNAEEFVKSLEEIGKTIN